MWQRLFFSSRNAKRVDMPEVLRREKERVGGMNIDEDNQRLDNYDKCRNKVFGFAHVKDRASYVKGKPTYIYSKRKKILCECGKPIRKNAIMCEHCYRPNHWAFEQKKDL
jgi:hypothetical protein